MPKNKILSTKKVEDPIKYYDGLPSLNCMTIFISPPGGGKSTIIANLVFHLYNQGNDIMFKRVIWCSPTIRTDKSLHGIRELEADPKNDKIEIQFITGDELSNLEEVIDGIKEYLEEQREEDKKNNIRTAVIIDDGMAYMRRTIQSSLVKLASCYRHIGYHTNLFIAAQSWTGLPKAVRELASAVVIGQVSGKTKKQIVDDMENVFDDKFEETYNKATNTGNKYDFCFVDNRLQKIFRNFETELYSKN
jgi:hypothetical protein